MKILIITAGRYPVPAVKGGAVSTLVEHLIQCNSKNKEFDMYVTSPYNEQAIKESKKYNNCTFEYFKTPKVLIVTENIIYKISKIIFPKKDLISIKSICSFAWFIIKNGKYLKKNEFDCVIIENTARLFWSIKLFGNRKKYKGKVYYHLHNKPMKIGGCDDVINECKGIICVSGFVKNAITTSKCNLYINDRDKVNVLYNCIDTSKFKCLSEKERIEFMKKLKINQNDHVILYSGRIDSEKGVLQLLESLDYIKTKNIKLLIVGSSFYGMDVKTPFEEKIINIAEKNKDKIIFTGFLKYSDMPKAYSICEIAVLPSLCDEAAGLTIIEAMACEKAVITTNSGGIPEYADSDSTIMLERDKMLPINIAKNIDYLLFNTSKMKTMGEKGRHRIVENFDSKQYLDRLASIIKEK